MQWQDGILRLEGLDPIAAGSRRLIFGMPGDPGTVVKVDRPDWARIPGGALKRLKRRILPSTDGRDRFIEAREALRVLAKLQGMPLASPVPEFRGFARTDIGLGTLHAHVRDADGATATSVLHLPRTGGRLDPDVVAAMGDLMRRLLTLGVVVNDLHAGNVVVSRGGPEPVGTLVDGYGDRATVPLRTMSRRLNDWKLHRRIARFAPELSATWDPVARQFRTGG